MRNNNGFKGLLVALLALSLTLAACSNDNGANGGNYTAGGMPSTNSEGSANAGSGNAPDGNSAGSNRTSGNDAANNPPTNASNNAAETPAPSGGAQESEAPLWEGRWQLKDANENRGSIIMIQAPQGERVAFSLDAYYLGNPDDEHATPNIGNIPNGEAVIAGNTATFTDDSLGFALTMTLADGELIVESTKETGFFGQGVNVDGAYAKVEAPE